MSDKTAKKVGWFASIIASLMFFSYIDQIRLNIAGSPGSVILPVVTVLNCSSWVAYALLKQKKDWPIVLCNALGIIVGFLTAITAFMSR